MQVKMCSIIVISPRTFYWPIFCVCSILRLKWIVEMFFKANSRYSSMNIIFSIQHRIVR